MSIVCSLNNATDPLSDRLVNPVLDMGNPQDRCRPKCANFLSPDQWSVLVKEVTASGLSKIAFKIAEFILGILTLGSYVTRASRATEAIQILLGAHVLKSRPKCHNLSTLAEEAVAKLNAKYLLLYGRAIDDHSNCRSVHIQALGNYLRAVSNASHSIVGQLNPVVLDKQAITEKCGKLEKGYLDELYKLAEIHGIHMNSQEPDDETIETTPDALPPSPTPHQVDSTEALKARYKHLLEEQIELVNKAHDARAIALYGHTSLRDTEKSNYCFLPECKNDHIFGKMLAILVDTNSLHNLISQRERPPPSGRVRTQEDVLFGMYSDYDRIEKITEMILDLSVSHISPPLPEFDDKTVYKNIVEIAEIKKQQILTFQKSMERQPEGLNKLSSYLPLMSPGVENLIAIRDQYIALKERAEQRQQALARKILLLDEDTPLPENYVGQMLAKNNTEFVTNFNNFHDAKVGVELYENRIVRRNNIAHYRSTLGI